MKDLQGNETISPVNTCKTRQEMHKLGYTDLVHRVYLSTASAQLSPGGAAVSLFILSVRNSPICDVCNKLCTTELLQEELEEISRILKISILNLKA